MNYYYSKKIFGLTLEETIDRVKESLKSEGFGVLTEIDIKETLQKKLGVDFHPYRILGACNPSFAYKALQWENKIGAMLPCNVIVQEINPGEVEVAAVDPVASMMAINNKDLATIAHEVKDKLIRVIDDL